MLGRAAGAVHGAEGEGGEEVVSREQRQQQRGQGGTARGQELVLNSFKRILCVMTNP